MTTQHCDCIIATRTLCTRCAPRKKHDIYDIYIPSITTNDFKSYIENDNSSADDDLLDTIIDSLCNGPKAADFISMTINTVLVHDASKNNIRFDLYSLPADFKLPDITTTSKTKSINKRYVAHIKASALKSTVITIGCSHCTKSDYGILKDQIDGLRILNAGDGMAKPGAVIFLNRTMC